MEKVKTEALLTKFYVFTGSADRRTWSYAGSVLARDRDHAVRLFYPDAAADYGVADVVAVSENAWKPRRRVVAVVPRAKLEEAEMPKDSPGPHAGVSRKPAKVTAPAAAEAPAAA